MIVGWPVLCFILLLFLSKSILLLKITNRPDMFLLFHTRNIHNCLQNYILDLISMVSVDVENLIFC